MAIGAISPQKFWGFFFSFFLESAEGGRPTRTWDGGRHFTCVSKIKKGIKEILSLRGREKHLKFCNREPHSGTSCRDPSSHPFIF